MLYKEYLTIENLILHRVGNKLNQESIVFSKSLLDFSNEVKNILIDYFLQSFKSEEYYTFYHSSDLELNESYNYISKILDNPNALYEQSVNLAKHLYEQSTHPKIKGGEFYVVYFKDCILDGKTMDAIGLFKSENKDTFLKIYPSGDGFEIESEKGININKLDKGCLIFNTEKENGYLVSVVDNTNKGGEAKYWTEDFLHVRPRKDEFYHTQNVLSLCKNFVSQALPKEHKVNKAEQAILMNKSVDALKNGSVDMNQFAQEVFTKPEIVDSFNKYKEVYQQERDIQLSDNFKVSSQALKKKGNGTMTTIKLDKNFDINIHSGEQYIERGFDKERNMYYYQLFFKEEKVIMTTIIKLDNKAAKKFFLKSESFCSIDLPVYFDFTIMLNKIDAAIRNRTISACCNQVAKSKGIKKEPDYPNRHDKVNYKFLTNKDGKYAWRPFQLIHPVIYTTLINCITQKENWCLLQKRFSEFNSISQVDCISIPVQSESKSSDKADLVSNWWQGLEQESIKLSMKFSYMFQTDITDCYGSIYTHSIVWALHGKEESKKHIRDTTYLGNMIDNQLQAMSYGQTNGIPQGCSLMDFLAELLLGFIDLTLSKRLDKVAISSYHILRYRDDYRIFSNKPDELENIAKILSETLSEVGLKLNISKTSLSNDIITDAIKPDKLFFIKNKTILNSLQKKLLFIRAINQQYPNSGVVISELSRFNKLLNQKKKINEDIEVLISIIIDIAKSAPKSYAQITATLSRLIAFIKEKEEKKTLLKKVYEALKEVPNNSYFLIWLQRLVYPVDREIIKFSEPLCKIVEGKSHVDNLWFSDWLDPKIKKVLCSTNIIDEKKLAELPIIIDRKEVDLFDNY